MSDKNLLDSPDILREIIMDHYQYPRNHTLVENDPKYKMKHMASDSCIDDITVQSDIEAGVIKDVRFDGVACTISTSSTSVMTELLKGKTIPEAKKIIHEYLNMADGKEYDADLLGEAVIMKNVYKQPNRIKCATTAWHAMENMIEESEEESCQK